MTTKRNVKARRNTVVPGTGRAGAPTRLTGTGIERVEALAATGLRQVSIAALLGLGRDAFESALEHQPEVRAAFERGRAALEQELATMLVAHARKGNIAATIFSLKNIANWSDGGIRGEQAPAVAVQINIPPGMSEDEFRRIVEGKAEKKHDGEDA